MGPLESVTLHKSLIHTTLSHLLPKLQLLSPLRCVYAAEFSDAPDYRITGAFTADMGDGDNTLDPSHGAANAVIASLTYTGLGGDDTVSFGDGTAAGVAAVGNVTVNAGAGDNAFTVTKETVTADVSYVGQESLDTVTLVGSTFLKNVSVNVGTGSRFDSSVLALNGATVKGNVTDKGLNGSHFLQTMGTASTVEGPAGVTLDSGTGGVGSVSGQVSLAIPNGGLTVRGKNGSSSVSMGAGAALSMGKDLTMANASAVAGTRNLAVRGVTITAAGAGYNFPFAVLSVNGAAAVRGAVKIASRAGFAQRELNGATADIAGPVSVSGGGTGFGSAADVTDATTVSSRYRSSVTVTSPQAAVEFRHTGASALNGGRGAGREGVHHQLARVGERGRQNPVEGRQPVRDDRASDLER